MTTKIEKTKRWIRFALLAYLAVEVGSYAGLAALKLGVGAEFGPVSTSVLPSAVCKQLDRVLGGRDTYLEPHAELGWVQRTNGQGGTYRANGQGLRGNHDYTRTPAIGVTRIAAFGDSFTHGDDVGNDETWQAQLEPMLERAEVLNFGVPAYGIDQAYLRYLSDGRNYKPDVVLIGVMPENIFRSINVWRPFYRANYDFPLTKPRFRLVAGKLELLPNPVANLDMYRKLRNDPASLLPAIAKHDSLFAKQYERSVLDFLPSIRLGKMMIRETHIRMDPVLNREGEYNVEHEAFDVLTATLAAFARAVEAEGSKPLVVLLPNRILPKGSMKTPAYSPLLDWMIAKPLSHVDLQSGFDKYLDTGTNGSAYVGSSGHYSPASNRIVALRIRDELLQRSWVAASNNESK